MLQQRHVFAALRNRTIRCEKKIKFRNKAVFRNKSTASAFFFTYSGIPECCKLGTCTRISTPLWLRSHAQKNVSNVYIIFFSCTKRWDWFEAYILLVKFHSMETVADFRRLSVKKFCQVKAESKNQLSKTATMQYEQTVPNEIQINMRTFHLPTATTWLGREWILRQENRVART